MKKFKKILTFLFITSLVLSSSLKLNAQENEVITNEETETTEVVTQPAETTTTAETEEIKETETATVPTEEYIPEVTEEENVVPTTVFRSAIENRAASEYEATVTFVTAYGNQVVQFHSGDELLNKTDEQGNKLNTSDWGGGTSKRYFLFLSNQENYLGSAGAKGFYADEPISNIFPDGIPADAKIYAQYLDQASVITLYNKLTGDVVINKDIDTTATMYGKFEALADEENAELKRTFYIPNDVKDLSEINLGANFTLNPYYNMLARYSPSHYFQPGTLEHYGISQADRPNYTQPDEAKEKYTYVDLYVELDERIEVSNQLSFDLYSYSFKPLMVLDENYNKLDANFTIENGNPTMNIQFNPNGMKKFYIRTQLRDRSEIPGVSFEDANTVDMRLITESDQNFRVAKEELVKIAKGEAEPLKIAGYIEGGAKLYALSFFGIQLSGPTAIPRSTAKTNLLDYKLNIVTFNLNTDAGPADDLGASYVVHQSSLAEDFLNEKKLPDYVEQNGKQVPAGDSYLDNPDVEFIVKDGKKLYFRGWATTADAEKPDFTATTKVIEDITVYAVWSEKITTKWVDDKGNVLKPEVEDFDFKEPGTITGYKWKETKKEDTITIHIFTKVEVVVVSKPSLPATGINQWTDTAAIVLLAIAALLYKRK